MMSSRIFDSLSRFIRPTTKPATEKERLTHGAQVFIVDEVKRGGMGVVYLCHFGAEQALRVALKTFDEKDFFDPQTAATIDRESSVWGRLADVPYVFPLADILNIDGKPHYMMPVAEPDDRGVVSVRDALRQSPSGLPTDECLRIALCISLAMNLGSQRIPTLVHGDIKPDNVLYLGGMPFLADFGLAGKANQAGRRGTAPYMAPELWTEDGRQSEASDVYAFGVMLAELLTGLLPLAIPDVEDDWQGVHATEAPIIDSPNRESDELTRALCDLAQGCFAKAQEARPASFAEIFKTLSQIGFALSPGVTMLVLDRGARLKHGADERLPEVADTRISSMLRQGDTEGALEVLSRIPSERLTGRLLIMAGTTHSLAGDDEAALGFFDRFLNSDPASKGSLRVRCLCERGLSLKRLGRLDEAKSLYRELLPEAAKDPDLALTIRGNYAGVLMEAGNLDEARRQLEWLVRRNPESPETQALYAQVLEESGQLAEATDALERAIAVAPRNGGFHVSRARVLFRMRRVADALESVDRAYALGHHDKEWLTLALAANMALGDKGAVANLMRAAQAAVPNDVLQEIVRDVVERLRALAGEDIQKPETPSDDASDVEAATAEPSTERTGTSPPSASNHDDREERHRATVASGRQPHLQMRMSQVDGSFAFDFYLGLNDPDYVDEFREAYLRGKAECETMLPGVAEREAPYRVACCSSCRFAIMTARDEGESFACQACGERATIESVATAEAAELGARCRAAIGREPTAAAAQDEVALAFWLAPEQIDRVRQRMREEGFLPAPEDASAFSMFDLEYAKRNAVSKGRPTFVWHRALDAGDTLNEGQTPHRVDLLLRALRREVGAITSISSVLPHSLMKHMVAGGSARLELLRAACEEDPDDCGLVRALVTAELELGNIEEARRSAAAAEIANPDDTDVMLAVGAVELASDKADTAALIAERVIDVEPRNMSARILAMKAYDALGDSDAMQRHAREYEALGGMLASPTGGFEPWGD